MKSINLTKTGLNNKKNIATQRRLRWKLVVAYDKVGFL